MGELPGSGVCGVDSHGATWKGITRSAASSTSPRRGCTSGDASSEVEADLLLDSRAAGSVAISAKCRSRGECSSRYRCNHRSAARSYFGDPRSAYKWTSCSESSSGRFGSSRAASSANQSARRSIARRNRTRACGCAVTNVCSHAVRVLVRPGCARQFDSQS
jgi:hypothetical protein